MNTTARGLQAPGRVAPWRPHAGFSRDFRRERRDLFYSLDPMAASTIGSAGRLRVDVPVIATDNFVLRSHRHVDSQPSTFQPV